MDKQDNRTTEEVLRDLTEYAPEVNKEKEVSQVVDVGLDISTTTVGYTVVDHTSGDILKIGFIKPTGNDFWEKVSDTEAKLVEALGEFCICRLFVEENMKAFKVGFSSADTLFTLAKFNGIVSYFMKGVFHPEIIDVNVRTARKLCGITINQKDKSSSTKEKVLTQVVTLFPTLPWEWKTPTRGKNKGKQILAEESGDMADSLVIVKGGRVKFINEHQKI